VWAAALRDLTEEDGPMYVLPGSHKLGLIEYKASKAADAVTQLEVPREIVDQFNPVVCDLKRGDAVIFHQNLVHSTGTNMGKLPRASIVTRYFSTATRPDLMSPLQFKNPKKMDDVMAAGLKAAS
jgi:phytanoyl-CoA hydroxylase